MLGWSLYDWANSAFSTTIMAAFFPIFFKSYWSQGDAGESTIRLALANSAMGILIAVMAPLLGAVADRRDGKKGFLIFFAAIGFTSSILLVWPNQGEWRLAAAIYVLAGAGFFGANIFYDSLLPSIVRRSKLDMVSTLGFSLGYLGGGLLFGVNVLMTSKPEAFGLSGASEAVKWSFVTVGIWWALFTLPLIFWVGSKKGAPPQESLLQSAKSGLKEIKQTLRSLKHLKQTFLFLAGYIFYIDGVNTIIRMSADYGLSIGFKPTDMVLIILIVQFIGFPCTILFGKIAERVGARKGIYLGLAIYLFITLWGSLMSTMWEFYTIAALIGFAQGGLQALSRSYYSAMIPPSKSGEFFGIYNMFGKFSMVLGPILIALVNYISGFFFADTMIGSRFGIASVSILFIIGTIFLVKVDEEEALKEVKYLETH